MQNNLEEKTRRFTKARRKMERRKSWTSAIAIFVAMCTLYSLLLPAHTLEAPTFCGLDHEHTDQCYSNPDADVETESIWCSTLPDMYGYAADNAAAAARSQLGYQESAHNYQVVGDFHKGYTRYGAWYGDPYSDWNIHFVQFCLYYAGASYSYFDTPYEWAVFLQNAGRYVASDPQIGDIGFYQTDSGETRCGIVTGTSPLTIIVGDLHDQVEKMTFNDGDWRILGFGKLPEGSYEPQEEPVEEASEEAPEEEPAEEAPEEETSAEDSEEAPEEEPAAEETAETETTEEQPAATAGELEQTIETSDGQTCHVIVRYDEQAGIPENAELAVREVIEEYDEYLSQTEETLNENERVRFARFFDITILVDGEEVQPQSAVAVEIQLTDADLADETSDTKVVHFGDEPEKLDAEVTEEAVSFETEGFSVFGVIYTVDFEYSVNGKMYQFSLPGGEKITLSDLVEVLGIIGDTNNGEKAVFNSVDSFLKEVANVEFSDESLVKVTQNEEGNDWTLESLAPFDTEESLTITMKNGDVVTVKVTDAQVIPDAEKVTFDPNKSYLICYEVNGVYYLLKNDGTVDSAYHPDFDGDPDAAHDFEHLNSTYAWSFNHIFKEQDVEHHLDKNYYLIRPIDDKAKTITLNNAGEALVQQGNNNVAVIRSGDGFILEGYHNIGTEEEHRYVHLGFTGGAFTGVDGDGVTVRIYEMDSLPTYDYTVRSANEIRGRVTVSDGTERTVHHEESDDTHYYDVTSNHDKKNAGTITAVPVQHVNQGQNKWLFDHWELDGLPLDRNQYPATINPETLPIPHNGSNLVAYFKQNPNYTVPPNEKEPSSIEDMTGWLEELQTRNIPLDSSATKKTAEVYDYQNRIYRVDFTSRANFETFAGNLDMAFCLDVSNSMYFPSALVATASANHTNPMPIYQINKYYSGTDWWNNYNNRDWLDQNRNWNNPYYLVADASGTATVFKIYYQDGQWKAQDASRTTESDKSFVIGDDFKTNWTADQYGDGNTKHPFSAGDDDNSTYMIYDAGDEGKNRFVYLNQSLSSSSTDLNTIANLLAVAGDASPGVKIAYNTFNKDLGNQRSDFQTASSGLTVNLQYASGGGTRPDQAFNDAQNFSWTAKYTVDGSGNLTATDRYVILVTDGAPQGVRDGEAKGTTNQQIETWVREAAQNLKNNSHVKLITVGLSMDNVTAGKRLLYDLADKDKNGEKMFYMAESGSDLENIFRQITKVLMEDAVVLGNITDTVGEGFYLVDKATGLPLSAGAAIDIEGNLTTDADKVAGVVQSDGRTIVWTNQPIDSAAGWHGTVYAKAQEELLGGNGMNTNDGEATIVATKYRVGGNDVPFDTALVRDTLNLTAQLPSPKVNVNELTFFHTETEWTVYLGEEVDPKQQLRGLYESLVVEEVVNEDGSLHYTLSPNSIEERWEAAAGTAATFSLPGLIGRLIRRDSSLEDRYYSGSELNWDVFLDDILSGGITLPYHEYGLTDGSNIKITLEKTISAGEEDDLINGSPHQTTVTGNEVEKYVLRIAYEPDYTVTPVGQGGQSAADFHTGTFGTMYQGHAAGREASENTHIINVYNVPLDVYKTDENDGPLSGAVFKLYKAGGSGTISGLSGNYTEVASGISGTDGVAHLTFAEGMETGLVPGTTYYLVEDKAPENYTKVNTVWTVQVQTEIGKFTNLNDEQIFAPNYPTLDKSIYPFNWDQGARIVVDGQPVKVVAKGEAENTTTTITNGSYVSYKDAISFRHSVKNVKANTSIDVKKIWNDDNESNHPESVTVKLYRVSEKGHLWDNGTIVPCTCTEDGVKEYTCSVCGEKDTHAIDKAGHKPGDAHRENYHAPTCTEPGGFDTVVRCTVCNAIISSKSESIPATGHTWLNQETATSDPDHYCYDIADVCSVCGAVNEETRSHHVHDWGAWEVTTPAQPGVAGEETRICRHDPSHVDHREIPALSTDHTVTIYFRCTGNGSGRIQYPGQVTSIATRSGTGSGDMTIKWNWDQWTTPKTFDVDGLGASTYTTSSNGSGTSAEQTLTISNITSDLTLYVTIRNEGYMGTNDGLIGQPTFSGNRRFSSRSLNKSSGSLLAGHGSNEKSLLNANSAPKLEGEGAVATPEVLDGISGLKTKAEASCGDIYWEEVSDTYQITAAENWTLSIPDLPKYNEYGKEYTYYVEEIPVTGYDTTYSGQGTTTPEIINTPKVTDLTITKTWAFTNPSNVTKVEGKEWPQGVTVHVVVYSKTGDNDPAPTSYTVDLTADRPTYTFTGLPEYSNGTKIEYSVVEAGVTGLDSEHFNTVIEGSAESGYTIKNTEKEAGLTIIKSFEGSELTEAQKNAITFTVTGSSLKDRSTGNSVDRLTKTYAEFTEGQWVLNQSDGIVNGRTYTVTETNGNIEHYSRVTTVKVNDGNAASFVQDGENTNPSGSITMSGYQGTVTITNTYTRLVDLKIIKVDANGMTTLLKGARFELRKVDPENTTLSYLDDAATLPVTTGEDHKTGSNGEAVFENLAEGYYEVKEAEMPAGYVQTGDGVFYIKVENGVITSVERTITEDDKGGSQVVWIPAVNDAKFIFTAASGDDPATAKIGNDAGVALPSTGGPGTRQLKLTGLFIALTAGVLLLMKQVERKGGGDLL